MGSQILFSPILYLLLGFFSLKLFAFFVKNKYRISLNNVRDTTLVYRIDMQDEINVQVGKFLKNIKRAGQNRSVGGNCFSKSINMQTQIRPHRGDLFSQNS